MKNAKQLESLCDAFSILKISSCSYSISKKKLLKNNRFLCDRYVVGGRLLNIFTEFYYLEDSDNHLTPTSPQWIGAWWLGFLLILVLSYICAALISIFPAKLRLPNGGPEEKHRSTKKETGDDNVENVLAVSTLEYGRLQDIPKALYNLITNPTYMSITFGATMDAFLLAGK